jgi:segregation and condensation protein A
MLELVQQKFMSILTGEGRNNFIVEFNPDRPDDPIEGGLDFPQPSAN